MEKKQSSIDWLNRWFIDNQEATYEEGEEALKQAKAMHQKEILQAFEKGYVCGYTDNGDEGIDYYNETFGGQDNE